MVCCFRGACSVVQALVVVCAGTISTREATGQCAKPPKQDLIARALKGFASLLVIQRICFHASACLSEASFEGVIIFSVRIRDRESTVFETLVPAQANCLCEAVFCCLIEPVCFGDSKSTSPCPAAGNSSSGAIQMNTALVIQWMMTTMT